MAIDLGEIKVDETNTKQAFKALRDEMKRLEKQLQGVQEEADDVGDELGKVGKKAKRAGDDAKKGSKGFGNLKKGISGAGKEVTDDLVGRTGKFGSALGALGPAGIAAAAGIGAVVIAGAGLAVFANTAFDVTEKNTALIQSFEALGSENPVQFFDELNDTILDLNLNSERAFANATRLFAAGFSEDGIVNVTKSLADLEARIGGAAGTQASESVGRIIGEIATTGRAGREQIEQIAREAKISVEDQLEIISETTGIAVDEVRTQMNEMTLDPNILIESVVTAIQSSEGAGADAAAKAASTIGEAYGGVKDLFLDLFDFSTVGGEGDGNPLISILISVQDALKESRDVIDEVKEDIGSAFQSIFGEAAEGEDIIKSLVKNGVVGLFESVKFATNAIVGIVDIMRPFINGVMSLNEGLDDQNSLLGSVGDVLKTVTGYVGTLFTAQYRLIGSVGELIDDWNILKGLGTGLTYAFKGVAQVFDTVTDALDTMLGVVNDVLNLDFKNIGNRFSNFFDEVGSSARNRFTGKDDSDDSGGLEAPGLSAFDIAMQDVDGTSLLRNPIVNQGLKTKQEAERKKAEEKAKAAGKKASDEAKREAEHLEKEREQLRKKYLANEMTIGKEMTMELYGNIDQFVSREMAKKQRVEASPEAQKLKEMIEDFRAGQLALANAGIEAQFKTFEEYRESLESKESLNNLPDFAKEALDRKDAKESLSTLEQDFIETLEAAGQPFDVIDEYIDFFKKEDLDETFDDLAKSQRDRLESMIKSGQSLKNFAEQLQGDKSENQRILDALNNPNVKNLIKEGYKIKVKAKDDITDEDLIRGGEYDAEGNFIFDPLKAGSTSGTSGVASQLGGRLSPPTGQNNTRSDSREIGGPKTGRTGNILDRIQIPINFYGVKPDMTEEQLKRAVREGVAHALDEESALERYMS